jgi:voltage-gated potassium channel
MLGVSPLQGGRSERNRAGVVGYRVLEGWSLLDALYMTVIALATVGFHEVQPLDAKGQVFTISLILAGVMSLFVALAW